MYSYTKLMAEIKESFSHLEKASGRVPKGWLVRSVMARHSDVQGEDADFALVGAEVWVTKAVEALFRSIKASEIDLDLEQLVMEGYDHIRQRYLVKESGEQVAISVAEMNSGQLREKAAQLRRFADGAVEHADELDRLADLREVEEKRQAEEGRQASVEHHKT